MNSFKQFLEERFKSEHEPIIRKIASDARNEFFKNKRFCKYGDCTSLSHHVAYRLSKKYPSVKPVTGHDGYHSWVEIPEIKHFVDPTNDQFMNKNYTKKKKSVPTKNGLYPDNAIKIGSTKGNFYGVGHNSRTIDDKDFKYKHNKATKDKEWYNDKDSNTAGMSKKERIKYHYDELKKLPNSVMAYKALPEKSKKEVDKKMKYHTSQINKLNSGY